MRTEGRAVTLALAVALATSAGRAQDRPAQAAPEPVGQPARSAAPANEPAEARPAASGQAPKSQPDTQRGADDLEPAPPAVAEGALLPPPPAPEADDQHPAPVLEQPPPIGPMRRVELGAHSGVAVRPASNGTADYAPSFAIGGHARLELAPWMGLRILSRYEEGGVESSLRGAERLDLHRFYLGAWAEPTWPVTEWLRIWGVAGIGWARTTSEPETTEASPRDRTGVFLEFPVGLGGAVEVVEDWVVLSVSITAGFLVEQSGSLFEPVNVVGEDGMLETLDPLPKLGTSLVAVGGVGVLL